jgi:hypothetical protein
MFERAAKYKQPQPPLLAAARERSMGCNMRETGREHSLVKRLRHSMALVFQHQKLFSTALCAQCPSNLLFNFNF